MCQLSMKEPNAEKWRKLADLMLSEDKWTWVRLFNNLLDVGYFSSVNAISIADPNFCSMLMRRSMRSLLQLGPYSIVLFWPLKSYMLSGATQEKKNNTGHSSQHLMLRWPSLMSTMRELPPLMPIS